jgi:hypothetical protein
MKPEISTFFWLDRKESKLSYDDFHLVRRGVQSATPGKWQEYKTDKKDKNIVVNNVYN